VVRTATATRRDEACPVDGAGARACPAAAPKSSPAIEIEWHAPGSRP
jgi:hypothetical protein